MILVFRKAWAASSMISQLSLDSAIFSLSCFIPVPPVFGVPFRSIILSALFLAPAPSLSLVRSSLTTSNSPLNKVSFVGSMTYLSVFRRDALIPGTVSIRPSNEAEIWNSLKRQAMTQPVVALERPTWSLMITGVAMPLPIRVSVIMSKSFSRGAAELQTGTRMWTSPGNFSFRFSMTLLRLRISLTSFSDTVLLMSTTFSFPPLSAILFSHSSRNLTSVALAESLVTLPSSAYSPILLGGLAHTGSPLMYTSGSCLILIQMIFPVLG